MDGRRFAVAKENGLTVVIDSNQLGIEELAQPPAKLGTWVGGAIGPRRLAAWAGSAPGAPTPSSNAASPTVAKITAPPTPVASTPSNAPTPAPTNVIATPITNTNPNSMPTPPTSISDATPAKAS